MEAGWGHAKRWRVATSFLGILVRGGAIIAFYPANSYSLNAHTCEMIRRINGVREDWSVRHISEILVS